MNYLTDHLGKEIEARNPLAVTNPGQAREVFPVTGETVTFKVGAAGFRGIVSLKNAPILNPTGSRVGSFWRDRANLMVKNGVNAIITALTETDGAAAITILDLDNNLEQLFEVTSGNSEYILVATDPSGDQLYGYIRGIATTGNSYAITINNTLAGGTANWIGSQANFDSSDVTKLGFEIYSVENSTSWTTGTILTQEVQYSPGNSDIANLRLLTTNGDYSIDYARGRIFYRKATTGTSDTLAYTTAVGRSGFENTTAGVALVKTQALATTVGNATRGQNNSFTTTNIKASAGKVYYACVSNTTGVLKYFQLHNTATTPAGGATASLKFPVPANDTIILQANDLGYDGAYFSTGIAIAASSTLTTYTAVTAGDLVVDYEYI